MWGSTKHWQDPATVTEHVRRLRVKLSVNGDLAKPRWIHTVRGVGYRFFDAGPVLERAMETAEP